MENYLICCCKTAKIKGQEGTEVLLLEVTTIHIED